MRKLKLSAPSPALIISLLALFVALGGTSYAALGLPKNSVGTQQLKKGAVTAAKIAVGARTGTLKPGETITGFFTVQGEAAGSGYGFVGGAGFQLLPKRPIPLEDRDLVTGSSGPRCPGVGRADPGVLCVYETFSANVSAAKVFAEDGHQLDSTRTGFGVQAVAVAAGDVELGVSWAYTQR